MAAISKVKIPIVIRLQWREGTHIRAGMATTMEWRARGWRLRLRRDAKRECQLRRDQRLQERRQIVLAQEASLPLGNPIVAAVDAAAVFAHPHLLAHTHTLATVGETRAPISNPKTTEIRPWKQWMLHGLLGPEIREIGDLKI